MQIILLLHVDGDGYLKYLLDRVNVEHKTIEEYSTIYTDEPIVYKNKVYLNGEVITQEMNYKYIDRQCCCYLPIDADKVDRIKAIKELVVRHDNYGGVNDLFSIYGNAYWIEDSDGTSFEINKYIGGYGSF